MTNEEMLEMEANANCGGRMSCPGYVVSFPPNSGHGEREDRTLRFGGK